MQQKPLDLTVNAAVIDDRTMNDAVVAAAVAYDNKQGIYSPFHSAYDYTRCINMINIIINTIQGDVNA